MTVLHNPSTAPLYRLLASVMTELKEAGEIQPGVDHTNMDYLIEWDGRRKAFVYKPENAE